MKRPGAVLGRVIVMTLVGVTLSICILFSLYLAVAISLLLRDAVVFLIMNPWWIVTGGILSSVSVFIEWRLLYGSRRSHSQQPKRD